MLHIFFTFYNAAQFSAVTRNQVLNVKLGELIDAFLKLYDAAARKIGPSNAAIKNHISSYEQFIIWPVQSN